MNIPVENLITPEYIRKLCWQEPPKNISDYQEFIESELVKSGARNWQIEQVISPMEIAIAQTEPLVITEPDEGEAPEAGTKDLE